MFVISIGMYGRMLRILFVRLQPLPNRVDNILYGGCSINGDTGQRRIDRLSFAHELFNLINWIRSSQRRPIAAFMPQSGAKHLGAASQVDHGHHSLAARFAKQIECSRYRRRASAERNNLVDLLQCSCERCQFSFSPRRLAVRSPDS